MGMMQSVNATVKRSFCAEQLQSQGRLSKQDFVRDLENATPASDSLTMTVARAALRKWVYNLSGFNKYGLHHNDCLDDTFPDVKKALSLLPQHIKDERNYRIIRALQLSMTHTILPQCEWTKYEEDDRYLQPYLDAARKDREEREQWNKSH